MQQYAAVQHSNSENSPELLLLPQITPIYQISCLFMHAVPIYWVYRLQSTLLVHDCIYNHAPPNIRNTLHIAQNPNHNLRNQSSNPLDLKVPNLKSRAGSHSFRQIGSGFWNMVPNELRQINQKKRFKTAMKRLTLENYEKKAVCKNPRCRDKGNHTCTG